MAGGFLPRWQGLVLACVAGFLALLAAWALERPEAYRGAEQQHQAAALFMDCSQEIVRWRAEAGLSTDPALDIHRSGFIGPEYTEFTTTLGNMEAKRTSVHPDFAALMTRYFMDLGLQKGDVIVVGASGSFPALLVSTLCAARVLELRPLILYSLGASMYGAGEYHATALEMLNALHRAGLLPYTVLAASMGGGDDLATDLIFPEAREYFERKGRELPIPFLMEPDLAASEAKRLAIVQEAAGNKPIRCFITIGGASVNMGKSSFALRLPAGLTRPEDRPDLVNAARDTQGLAAHYLRQGVPVVHLLDVRGLALRYGIPIDAAPVFTGGPVYQQPGNAVWRALVLALGLAAMLALVRNKRGDVQG